MLVYEKKVDGVRHLFGTTGNVPAPDDAQLKYKDRDGDVLTPVANDTYLDDGKGGIIRKSDNKFVGVFIGNADKAIIPEDFEPEVKELKSIAVKKAPTKVEYTTGETLTMEGLVLKATYKSGEVEEVEYGAEGITYSPAEGATVTASGDVTITFGGKTCKQSITFVA